MGSVRSDILAPITFPAPFPCHRAGLTWVFDFWQESAFPASLSKGSLMSFVATPAAVLNPWVRILGALEKKVNRQSFDTWLKRTRFSHAKDRMLFVRIPTPEFQHIPERYTDLIQEAIDALQLEFDDVTFITAEEDPTLTRVREDGGFAPAPTHAPHVPPKNNSRNQHARPAPSMPQQARFDWSTAAQLNPRYT